MTLPTLARYSPRCNFFCCLLLSALVHGAAALLPLLFGTQHIETRHPAPAGLSAFIRPLMPTTAPPHFQPAVNSVEPPKNEPSAAAPAAVSSSSPKDTETRESGHIKTAPPAIADELSPAYPLPLMAKGIRGYVTADIFVDEHAQLQLLAIVDSSPSGIFDQSVIDEIVATPRIKRGLASPGLYRVRFVFDPLGTK